MFYEHFYTFKITPRSFTTTLTVTVATFVWNLPCLTQVLLCKHTHPHCQLRLYNLHNTSQYVMSTRSHFLTT